MNKRIITLFIAALILQIYVQFSINQIIWHLYSKFWYIY